MTEPFGHFPGIEAPLMDDLTQDVRQLPAETSRPARQGRAKRAIGLIAGLAVAIAVIGTGIDYWLEARYFVSTDDATIDAYTTQVAPRIAGQVTKILFTDNQHVAAGQPLLLIDPRDYQAKLDQARAQQASAEASFQQAQAQVAVQQASVDQAIANIRVAEADLLQARQDYERFQKINPNAVTRQQVDAATAQFHSAAAKLDANKMMVGGAQAAVRAAQAQVLAAEASVRQAIATTRQAELQVSYCAIDAPVAGIVTHRSVDQGNYVNPGQAMFALVQDDRWVTANFKETQLGQIRPGQPVNITVDAAPSVVFKGRVDSFQAGTGSAFSTLPAENATGNYVKIVQRLPVKIVFDDPRIRDFPLAPGMSVVPSVRVR
jgi:membrane fusion protein (multidrug efflux system)